MTYVSLIYIIADIYSEAKANGALILGTVVFHQEDCSIGISSRGLCIMKSTSPLKCVISIKLDYCGDLLIALCRDEMRSQCCVEQ